MFKKAFYGKQNDLHLYVKDNLKMKQYLIALLFLFLLSFKKSDKPFLQISNPEKHFFQDTTKKDYPAPIIVTKRPQQKKADYYIDCDSIVVPKFLYKNETWQEYVSKNINQSIPKDNGAPRGVYNIVVSFVVKHDGSISGVKILGNPVPDYGMVNEVIRFIKDCPMWTPAVMNGRVVLYRMKQRIQFKVN